MDTSNTACQAGGLGLRSAVQLAPAAYLASVAASADLVAAISTAVHTLWWSCQQIWLVGEA